MNLATTNPSCGHSMEELSDYLDTGHTRYEEHIRHCPECQAALAALRRLNELTRQFLEADLRESADGDQLWLDDILNNLRLETKAGRTIPLTSPDPDDELSETEGAVIALIRGVADTIDGATIGRCRFSGDVTVPGAEIVLDLRVAVLTGIRIPDLADTLRTQLLAALSRHTELNVTTVNITVSDLRFPPQAKGPDHE